MSQSTTSKTSPTTTTPTTTLKTPATTTVKKKLRFRTMVSQVYRLFISSSTARQANEKTKKNLELPSISVTSPDG
ncbi:unnamed protein product, partial [Rotaria magnacalcarata]